MAQISVSSVGEFNLIAKITSQLTAGPPVRVGPGDDAAVIELSVPQVAVSTDALVEGVHFRCDWSSAEQIGRKAVAVNVADLEAMGARPLALVVALALPAATPTSWLESFAAGVRAECAAAAVQLVGGDLSRAAQIMITVTALGEQIGNPVTRAGAKAGEVVAVYGRLGWAGAGLAALTAQLDSPTIALQRVPEVPYGQGVIAAAAGATSMIDISDGLLADLGHIATASRVSLNLSSQSIPIAAEVAEVAAQLSLDPQALVLTSGEDHALAATFPALAQLPPGWVPIGSVFSASPPQVLVDGQAGRVAAGWDHFGESRPDQRRVPGKD